MEQNKNMADASMPSDAGGKGDYREADGTQTLCIVTLYQSRVSQPIYILYIWPAAERLRNRKFRSSHNVLHRVYYEIAPLYFVLTQSTQRRAGAIFIACKTASALTLLARLLRSVSLNLDVTRL